MDVTQLKKEMRRKILAQSTKLSKKEMEKMSDSVFSQIEELPEFRSAKKVAFFWSMPDEIPTHKWIRKWAEEKDVLLPVTEGGEMFFRRYSPDAMLKGELNYLEPKEGEVVEPKEIDFVIVPGVAFDSHGGRLGRGRAYYDGFLSEVSAPKVAVGMRHQQVELVPREAHDQLLDMVVLPQGRIK